MDLSINNETKLKAAAAHCVQISRAGDTLLTSEASLLRPGSVGQCPGWVRPPTP